MAEPKDRQKSLRSPALKTFLTSSSNVGLRARNPPKASRRASVPVTVSPGCATRVASGS